MSWYSVHGKRQIEIAEIVCQTAHGATGQKRKYTGEPYAAHPHMVAMMIRNIPSHTWQQVVLAYLHDVVEDTQLTLADITRMFGEEIATGVGFLTNVEAYAGNRAARHAMNVARLANAPHWVQTVKVADIYDNTRNIMKLDPVFGVKYLQEKIGALEVLKDADPTLLSLTYSSIDAQLTRKAAS